MTQKTRNVLSVDVEDYFHVEAFADRIGRDQWDTFPLRVEPNTMRLLDLFDARKVKATFFILGWVAERYPALVREIVKRGHEPACHSYWHRLIYQLTPEGFREDTRRAKDVVEQAAGEAVFGYRAPSYSITLKSLWAFRELVECGFRYDSSIFPIRHDIYGIESAPRLPFIVNTPAGSIYEYPITTFRFLGRMNMPVGGGGFLRLLPYWYTRIGADQVQKEGVPLITYVHPWEVDPEQPRIAGRLTSRVRHYTNLDKTEDRLGRLIARANFGPFRQSGLETAAQPFEMASLNGGNSPAI